MQPYQLEAGGHRGTRAVRRLIELAPATGALALWMRHRDVDRLPVADTREIDGPVANDGETLYYAPSFETLPPSRQLGLVVHQLMHVVLQHAVRREALARVHGPIDATLFNVAADAIVNSAVAHLDWLELSPHAVRLDLLLQRVLGIREPLDVSLGRWDVESLYRAIDDREARGGARRESGRAESSASGDAGRADSTARAGAARPDDSAQRPAPHVSARRDPAPPHDKTPRPTGAAEFTDGSRAHGARCLLEPSQRDLLPGATEMETAATRQREWSERLLRAHSSDGEFSLLRVLLADRRAAATPWQQLLRTRLARALAPLPALSWSRPSRSWLASRGRGPGGLRMPWQPGIVASRSVPKLVVIVDVSGSVEDGLLQRFATEIERLMRLFRNETRLIAGDERVRLDLPLEPGARPLRSLRFDGGGGTDLTPMLQAADRYRPDIGVFLTDLDGPIGFKPRWPVVWALPATSGGMTPPFGTRVILS